MSTLDRETRQLINAARTLGTESLSIYLEDDELLRLCAVIAADLGISPIMEGVLTSVTTHGGTSRTEQGM